MAVVRKTNESSTQKTRRPPATTPEARERQLTALAYDLAEQQLNDGTASAQVQIHFLKMGTERYRLEQQKVALENNLLSIRAEDIKGAARMEELYTEAIRAMREYGGKPTEDDDPLD